MRKAIQPSECSNIYLEKLQSYIGAMHQFGMLATHFFKFYILNCGEIPDIEEEMFQAVLGTRVRREESRNSGLFECAFYFAA